MLLLRLSARTIFSTPLPIHKTTTVYRRGPDEKSLQEKAMNMKLIMDLQQRRQLGGGVKTSAPP